MISLAAMTCSEVRRGKDPPLRTQRQVGDVARRETADWFEPAAHPAREQPSPPPKRCGTRPEATRNSDLALLGLLGVQRPQAAG